VIVSLNKDSSLVRRLKPYFRYILLCLFLWALSCYSINAFAIGSGSGGSGGPFRWHRNIKGPLFSTPNFNFYFGGFLQADLMSLYGAAPQLQGISNWRDARASVGFDLYQNWQFDMVYDFKQDQLLNAYFAYVGKYFTVMLGQVFPVFGIANTADTSQITFLELPLPVFPFSTAYYPGIEVGFYKTPFSLYASIFGAQLGTTVHGRNPMGGTISAAYSPIHTEKKVFVVSLSGWQQAVDSFHVLNLFSPPELIATNEGAFIDTGNISNVKNFKSFDGGAAGVYGPFSLQGEYIYAWVNRINAFPILKLHGFYVTASYFLTGESRLYNFEQAGFIGVSPIKGKHGAWQIALRYSQLNLMSQDVTGGDERNITIALNWYPFQQFVFKFNYIRAIARPNSDGKNQPANLYILRLQVVF